MENDHRKPYPSDVSDEEWTFVAPYLTLMTEAAPQRRHDLREVFNGLRYIVRTGVQWRQMPHELPPWPAVHQQTQRWLGRGCLRKADIAPGTTATNARTAARSILADVDQGYTGDQPARAAAAQGIALEVITLPDAKRGFVLVPRRWVVERSFAWVSRFRGLARDYERMPTVLEGVHSVALPCGRSTPWRRCCGCSESAQQALELPESPDSSRIGSRNTDPRTAHADCSIDGCHGYGGWWRSGCHSPGPSLQSQTKTPTRQASSAAPGRTTSALSAFPPAAYVAVSEYAEWRSAFPKLNQLDLSPVLADHLPDGPRSQYLEWIEFVRGDRSSIEEHDRKLIETTLPTDKAAFDRVESYPLTRQQRRAIITNDNTNLVIAGAGTGKTSTIVGKVDYLVRHGLAEPDDILLLAYNRSAADELKQRIGHLLGHSKVSATTFHALGLRILGEATNQRPSLSKLAEDDTARLDFIRGQARLLVESPATRAQITEAVSTGHCTTRAQATPA